MSTSLGYYGKKLERKKDYGKIVMNPFHPKISLPFLHTALYTFPKVLTRRICLPIKNFFL